MEITLIRVYSKNKEHTDHTFSFCEKLLFGRAKTLKYIIKASFPY